MYSFGLFFEFMKTGKTVILVFLLLLWVPFVMQTDLYPFFRFGMFAEPVKREVQTETFGLRITDVAGKQRIVAPQETGLGSLTYLMRNYYYRQQSDTLLRRIHSLSKISPAAKQWQLLRIVSEVSHYKPDTAVVATFKVTIHE